MTPMSAADRVRLSRWVNKFEGMADELLMMLKGAPDPLPRDPVVEAELVERLSQFVARDEIAPDRDFERVRFLRLGNGNQSANRKRAMRAAASLLKGVRRIDDNTVQVDGHGAIHFAAFTHPKGAMISSPQMQDANFGGAGWHQKGKIMMFRDVGDGRCIVYICDIASLFPLRTIGQHGVTWEDVQSLALKTDTVSSAEAFRAAGD